MCNALRAKARVNSETVTVFENGPTFYRITTDHFVMFVTDEDADHQEDFAAAAEASLKACQQILPASPRTSPSKSFVAYIVSNPVHARAITQMRLGADAPEMKIERGGYTVDAYILALGSDRTAQITILSHEIFHATLGRHVAVRPPAFLEEGIASMFERVTFDSRKATVDRSFNAMRGQQLAKLIDDGPGLLPLKEMVTLDAGQIMTRRPDQASTFYSQAWALAMFLDAQPGPAGSALRSLLADAVAGAGPFADDAKKRDARAIVEHYAGGSLESIEPAYRRFVADRLAYRR
ncbi:MAG: hypothetical protein QM770_11030 [Tepidisphaeraceae bacterium]